MSKGVISSGESELNRNSRADLKTDVRSDLTITSAWDVHVGQDQQQAAPRSKYVCKASVSSVICSLWCASHRDTNQSVAKRP